jgi:hypothetical protein
MLSLKNINNPTFVIFKLDLKNIVFKITTIAYTDTGKGTAIVCCTVFRNKKMWDITLRLLQKKPRNHH